MPKAARKIVESRKYLVFSGIFVVILSLANLVVAFKPKTEVQVLAASTANNTEKEIEFWQNVVRLHPTYRDGYIELTKLYSEAGLNVAAKQAIEKAIEIDPLSIKAQQLASSL